MLLESLREYSTRLDLPPVMYVKTPIRWFIDLDSQGNLLGFVSATGPETRGKDRGKIMYAPNIVRSSGVKPKLLADKGDYVLGLASEKSKLERVNECHRAFIDLVRQCAISTGNKSVQAVLRFLENWDPEGARLPEDFNPGDNLTFRVDGRLPIEDPDVQSFWADYTNPQEGEATTCLLCGQLKTPAERHPVKIKGIPGGQTAGMALVSANAAAFESYGLQASLIAPICYDCAERYGKAANALIENDATHLRLGSCIYLFWTREPSNFSIASLLSNPQPEDVKALLAAVYTGRQADLEDDNLFYATALSSSGGRVAVRDWLETTLGDVKRNLGHYFALQRLVDAGGREGPPLGLFPLAWSTVREPKDLPPTTTRALLHFALKGGALPHWLLYEAIKRARAEKDQEKITRSRAALIKMVLFSQKPNLAEGSALEKLDTSNRNPAYLCGRLLAVLEGIQWSALPGIKATIVDRFYGTASTAPAAVFSRLLRGSQSHLGKLRKEKPGLYYYWQQALESILGNLSSFPPVLTLEEQGYFALGYYHQRAANREGTNSKEDGEETRP
ncbi:type I-C CRISPR-associated protein Cas8c/Csd1 [Neomoorella thermoacetica]|uniref:CRISPR-associated protein n=1 Tax=Neomoorella thermoacetica TaxID=1525 RepID=A0A1J5JF05_NEOTH|nr:type I-C CRISPR-associated protein Cas8c/Csd1 [Moorella thermoacetica]OIQ07765.1 CRISPR-associated protein [Moorella thermoacetica]OIQ53778.1 CRISPR-associated protein [Moorella thermoacetica]